MVEESIAAAPSSAASQYPVRWPAIDPATGSLVYRGEGNANLVLALPSERKVIRLRKAAESCEQPVDEEEELRRAERQVRFVRGAISGLLGRYVAPPPEIVRCDRPEIARLSEQIRPERPESRRDKEIVGGYALKFPDYTFLPARLAGLSREPTYCVEIKPKQGFVCDADRVFARCPYCLMQYYKLQNGSTDRLSDYCPFDLFSCSAERMDQALRSLLQSPQNNLKIFRDGAIVYGGARSDRASSVLDDWLARDPQRSSLELFLRLVSTALTRPFDVAGVEFNEERVFGHVDVPAEWRVPSRLEPLMVERVKDLLKCTGEECLMGSDEAAASGSVLGRILRMQRLHRCGGDLVAWIHANRSARLSDELIYADLALGDAGVFSARIEKPLDPEEKNVEAHKSREPVDTIHRQRLCDASESGDDECAQDSVLQNMSFECCLDILKRYLLFCIAKDCSILMAFQEVDKELPSYVDSNDVITIVQSDKVRQFLVNVSVLDLDMKSVKIIEKHRQRDNKILKAVIEALEKKVPST